jgi:hypothetical protein
MPDEEEAKKRNFSLASGDGREVAYLQVQGIGIYPDKVGPPSLTGLPLFHTINRGRGTR